MGGAHCGALATRRYAFALEVERIIRTRATAKRVIDRSRRLFDLADGLAKRKYHAARAPC